MVIFILFLLSYSVINHWLSAAKFKSVFAPTLISHEAALVKVVWENLFVDEVAQVT